MELLYYEIFSNFTKFSHYHNCYHKVKYCAVLTLSHMLNVLFINSKQQNINMLTILCKDLFLEKCNDALFIY